MTRRPRYHTSAGMIISRPANVGLCEPPGNAATTRPVVPVTANTLPATAHPGDVNLHRR
jgi:hypothetical protein